MTRPRFVIDWDDTLVEDRWPDQGPWLPGAVAALHELNRLGDVVIFSCRVSGFAFPSMPSPTEDVYRDPEDVALSVERMAAMLTAEGLGHIEIWQRPYKPNATVYIDNKGLRFNGNWRKTLDDVYDIIAPITSTSPMIIREPHRTLADDIRDMIGEQAYASPAEGYVTYSSYVKDPPTAEIEQDGPSSTGLENYPHDAFRVDEVFQIVGYLTGAIQELHSVHVGDIAVKVSEAMDAIRGDRPMQDPDAPGRHPNSQKFHDRLDAWGNLHDRKQRDYGSDVDPFANIRGGAAEVGLPAWIGCAIRMRDKMQRILTAAKQYIETGEVSMANESLVDSFDDLGVYSGIGAVLLEEES